MKRGGGGSQHQGQGNGFRAGGLGHVDGAVKKLRAEGKPSGTEGDGAKAWVGGRGWAWGTGGKSSSGKEEGHPSSSKQGREKEWMKTQISRTLGEES